MTNLTVEAGQVTIGIDVSDKLSHFCVLDSAGEIIEEGRLVTSPAAYKMRFGSMDPCRISLEVGTHSPWISRLIKESGHDVLVANARRLRLIYQNDAKDDRVDAEYLARLARLDPGLLAPITHRTEDVQRDLGFIRARDLLIRSRTKLVNHVRGVVKSLSGGKLPKCSTESFARKVLPHLPEELQPILVPMLETISQLNTAIRGYDKQIDSLCTESYPETEVLRQVTGVGALTALAFVLILEDPRRFANRRKVAAYLGVVPKRDASGEKNPQLRITKSGNKMLRSLLVGSAQYILGPFGPDCDLRRWGEKLAERGGKIAKRRAVVAVARKLAILLHKLWLTGEVYEPNRNAA